MYNNFKSIVWSLKTLEFTIQIAKETHTAKQMRRSTSIVKCWREKRYIFIFLDGCALFPQYCRWTKTTASRQVNIELPESAVCSRQGLQQFITERQYKARPVWLELVNYNKSLGFFSSFLVTGDGGQEGGGGIPQALCYTTACFCTLRAYTHTPTQIKILRPKRIQKGRSVDTKPLSALHCRVEKCEGKRMIMACSRTTIYYVSTRACLQWPQKRDKVHNQVKQSLNKACFVFKRHFATTQMERSLA